MLLVAMPLLLVAFLFLVAMPGDPSSVHAPSWATRNGPWPWDWPHTSDFNSGGGNEYQVAGPGRRTFEVFQWFHVVSTSCRSIKLVMVPNGANGSACSGIIFIQGGHHLHEFIPVSNHNGDFHQ